MEAGDFGRKKGKEEAMKFETQQKKMSFREWVRLLEEGVPERVLLTGIFPPRDYPSWTLSFYDKLRKIRVRKSVRQEEHIKELKAWAQRLKGSRCQAFLSVTLQEGAVELKLDGVQPDQGYEYQVRNGGLVLTRVQNEDIPF
ncbi:MAG: hypothetical protein QXV47_07330 [Fervidicoccaceae archaeon]